MLYFGIKTIEKEMKMKKVLVLYYSNTGNTKKVASAIQKVLVKDNLEVTYKEIKKGLNVDFYEYDLVCFGTPVIHSFFPPVVKDFINMCEKRYRLNEEIFVAAPRLIGKHALIFITYSGPHCGINEALPTGKYMRQFFEHLGFNIIGEWYEVGEFHGWEQGSKIGRLGDIRGKPNIEDLTQIEEKTKSLIEQFKQ
jgi:flavodoxin